MSTRKRYAVAVGAFLCVPTYSKTFAEDTINVGSGDIKYVDLIKSKDCKMVKKFISEAGGSRREADSSPLGVQMSDWGPVEVQALKEKFRSCYEEEGDTWNELANLLPPAYKKIDNVFSSQAILASAVIKHQQEGVELSKDIERSRLIEVDIGKLTEMNNNYPETDQKREELAELSKRVSKEVNDAPPSQKERLRVALMNASKSAPLSPAEAAEQDQLFKQKKAAYEHEEQAMLVDAQNTMVAEELFIESHCPTLKPNEDMINSVVQQPDQPHVISPSKLDQKDKDAAMPTLQKLEAGTGIGFKPGSPMALNSTCILLQNVFVNMLHLYTASE